ncbi:MAG: helix-turn-helix transcriptional regulator [Roseomonas sp.]|nr:helix-turn-helix transcriptional regulator [Roseomonas sp.]
MRNRRTALGISLNDLAERLEISPAYWSRIERDHENPPRDELIERAAAILGVQVDELFVEAQRLPPDMRRDIGRVVLAYRRLRFMGKR